MMLLFADELKAKLYAGHGKEHFLRTSYDFSTAGKSDQVRGTLYDPAELPENVRDLGFRHAPHAVKCEWMQSHAFFWLYGKGDPSQRIMHFDANQRSLRPDEDWLQEFRSQVESIKPPFSTVATINFLEQYLRVAFSQADRLGSTYIMKTPYSATYQTRDSTKGLLCSVVSEISESKIGIRSVQMSTQAKGTSSEEGTFTFLADARVIPGTSSTRVEALNELAERGFDAATSRLHQQGCELQRKPFSIDRFGSRTLFLSVNFDWMLKSRTDLLGQIKRLAIEFGFVLVLAHDDHVPPFLAPLWKPRARITENILGLISACDGFLQILSANVSPSARQTSPETPASAGWLLFESGAANALQKPCEVCFDSSVKWDEGQFNERLGTEAGRVVTMFDGNSSDKDVTNSIRNAVARIHKQCVERSTKSAKP
ncbi:hypothetical protein C7S18_16860 [Ahniella affigens]|uniref:Uncharacterized protein n=2 Tax=Ahniella affigens TaxID=2021234 RepID=A0A2P1PV76_9GAMM|nr:hypothetical protein C7S18_16860 [Ahniella affigens]